MTINQILEDIRSSSNSEREKGEKFERLMLLFFRNDPTFATQFRDVWLWNDWPGREGRPDTGIDLVAVNESGDEITAIQCKNYAPHVTLNKEDIDSFFNESGKKPFTHRLIVSTTNNWSVHAENSLRGQDKPVRRIGIDILATSSIDWDSLDLENFTDLRFRPKKLIRPHQVDAINAVSKGFSQGSRGKLIMACGTGKTFVAQRVAEQQAGIGGSVLVLVPSISLLSQTIREWTHDALTPLEVFAVCSDPKAGGKRNSEDLSAFDLALPATTDVNQITRALSTRDLKNKMLVIFSTYQSIEVLSKAQKAGLPSFDLIISDEAHRTTGVTLSGEDNSMFTKVHYDKFVKSDRRLYMTATPRMYGEVAKAKAASARAQLASMDDEGVYGPEFHRLTFNDAVKHGLLSDYKVLILTVNEDLIAEAFQSQLADSDHEMKFDEATRIVGCLNAFAKTDPRGSTFVTDKLPMKRVVAFSNTIKNSKRFRDLFREVSTRFSQYAQEELDLKVIVDHVDGSFNSLKREDLLEWLKSDPADNECHVLSNAKCLTEGVDVPALDGIVFLEPRNSRVDVVQAVGRVMRKSVGKQYGYVILPIGIPSGVSPNEALNDNKRFAAVWEVLNALRSHDESLNAVINKLDINNEAPEKIEIVTVGYGEGKDEPTASDPSETPRALQLDYPMELREAIYAKIVDKVGTRQYWENWAKDVAKIAEEHVAQIESLLARKGTKASREFEQFLIGLQGNLNRGVTKKDAIEMLAQHLITKPVFDVLFGDFEFTEKNPVSNVMQNMITILEEKISDVELRVLDSFYENVKFRAEGIDNLAGKQKIIAELYEKFFRLAFSKTAEKMGIVYTPIPVVDFMINSVNEALISEFDVSLSDRDVHIIDPFTGTGTFVTRLLQSGLLSKDDLPRKYQEEIHANEVVLLAYYIAAINIEASFHELTARDYEPFDGIVLTDTFQLYEENDVVDEEVFTSNNERAMTQKKIPIQVVFGNPPYSVGQNSQNDNNANFSYPFLDMQIADTYARESTAVNKRNLYDSYFRAFRWASDRIQDKGVICFVTNGSWVNSNSADGFRKTLVKEFSDIYVLDLRGDAYMRGEARKLEGGTIFGEGSRTPIAITLLVKNPLIQRPGRVFYSDIGDSLSKQEKLSRIESLGSTRGTSWTQIAPDPQGDWLKQGDSQFKEFPPLGERKGGAADGIFEFFSPGIVTSRDSWVYNSSKGALSDNVRRMIKNYENLETKFSAELEKIGKQPRVDRVDDFFARHSDQKEIKWSRSLKRDFINNEKIKFDSKKVVLSMYRPFFKQYLYLDENLNEVMGRVHAMFPTPEAANRVIYVTGVGAKRPFSVIATDLAPDFHLMATGQAFPFYNFSENSESANMLDLGDRIGGYVRNDSITDATLSRYRSVLKMEVSKEDIFAYIYGLLSSPKYAENYQNSLHRNLPRIPILSAFESIRNIGRNLMGLHIQYEEAEVFPLEGIEDLIQQNSAFPVKTMKFDRQSGQVNFTTLILNDVVKVTNIPEEVFSYQLNGLSVFKSFIERYQLRIDQESGIENNPNLLSDDPFYIVKLLCRLVSVCLTTGAHLQLLSRIDVSSEGVG